jgi:hypothetical protein
MQKANALPYAGEFHTAEQPLSAHCYDLCGAFNVALVFFR